MMNIKKPKNFNKSLSELQVSVCLNKRQSKTTNPFESLMPPEWCCDLYLLPLIRFQLSFKINYESVVFSPRIIIQLKRSAVEMDKPS